MEFCIVSDEISQDIDAAVHIGTSWGIRHYEVRNIMQKRLPDGLTDKTVQQLLRLKEQYGITYTALSPGVFKCAPEKALMDEHLSDRLDQSIQLARQIGADTIVIFSLYDRANPRQPELQEMVIPYLKEACRKAEEAGLRLAIETEHGTACETAKQFMAVWEAVGSDALWANWDPANSWVAGEDPFEGYATLRGRITSIHIKDAKTQGYHAGSPWTGLGDGQIPWTRLLPRLSDDPTIRRMTMETHIHPKITQSQKALALLHTWLQNAGFESPLLAEELAL
ncbi:sugar phosphate isomerase/epimerase family protein [Paenibacillus cremeus]|uniref:Sugar phosphate isomerase/epimerase n=1 Tax=Paenibacillus cremeus TaxID=2163881 RepID=A0A559JVV0_9BACL|nr:sugar phosphate isomerase/epimerase family protein [Paenibacillus cremeus]TVY04003.1 sugar phosphate isomerase/epimerase [Paenibacillus cremeus]